MSKNGFIKGFSKLSAAEKMEWLKSSFNIDDEYIQDLKSHLHTDSSFQKVYEEFSENTISNFFIPYGLAPNFLINNKWYVVPMAIEESSVVAAASHAAKFWSAHNGFHAEIINNIKVGQVHFHWSGSSEEIKHFFKENKKALLENLEDVTASMKNRGGGIINLELVDKTAELSEYYQLHVKFRTANAMGANFINTVLEKLGNTWKKLADASASQNHITGSIEVNMAILSNYTPENLVRVSVKTDINSLGAFSEELSGLEFAEKFVRAVNIARNDIYRAVTHNKGIFNGMDGVVIATGNDFRAVEACGHAYAVKNGMYRSLSKAKIVNNHFYFELEIPMAVGTVGGLTSGHPLAKISMKILQDPNAEELMMIIAAAGLANNFSAIRSLITSGIQKGHMKMHLTNILRQLGASEAEKKKAIEFFKDKTISYNVVKKFLNNQGT